MAGNLDGGIVLARLSKDRTKVVCSRQCGVRPCGGIIGSVVTRSVWYRRILQFPDGWIQDTNGIWGPSSRARKTATPGSERHVEPSQVWLSMPVHTPTSASPRQRHTPHWRNAPPAGRQDACISTNSRKNG